MKGSSFIQRIATKAAIATGTLFAATLMSFAFASATHAASCTFTGAVSSDFNTNGNWSCGFTPGATSTAIIPTATSTSLSAPATVGSILVNSNATLTTSGQSFTSLGNISTSGTIIAGGANNITVGGIFDMRGGGSFTPGNGTLTFSTSTVGFSQDFTADTATAISINNLAVNTSGTLILTNTLSSGLVYNVAGTLVVSGGTLLAGIETSSMHVSGTTNVALGAQLQFGNGCVDSSFNGTFTNNGTFQTGASACTYTFNNDLVSTGSMSSGNPGGTWDLKKNLTNTGTMTPAPSFTVIFSGTSTQAITGGKFFNLTISNTSTPVTLANNATSTGTLTVSSGGTLAVGTNTLTASGPITNLGTITEGIGGKIVHTHESLAFTDGSGVTQASYTTPGTVYVQVQDSNMNLNGTIADTMTIPVSMSAGAGSDAETLTLTETGLATGIFRSAGIPLVSSSVASPGNSQFEITTTGIGTATYTDIQDGSDTAPTTATMTFATTGGGGGGGGGGSSGGGGGGGGLGSSGSNALAPLTTQYQSYLANLQTIGVPVHALVKLPDDGNASTQEDSAVYYIGTDGMRHAFPNSKVYFTWYSDFSGVQLVNSTQLASIPLGKNVTYKPGVKMVKFTTDPKVYAVEKGGNLRWVTTEAVATSLYGASWNTMIDDISDAFYSNYQFGTSINSTSDYSPSAAQASVQFPSDSLQM